MHCILRIRPFIDQYEWEEIHFPAESKDWKKFETNNKTIALNVLFLRSNNEVIKQTYISKHNSKLENKVIIFMLTGAEKWHYLTLKTYLD